MTEIRTPDSLSNLAGNTKRESGGAKNGLLRKEPSAAYKITQQLGFCKGDELSETSCFQSVPHLGTVVNLAVNPSLSSVPAHSVEQPEKVAAADGSLLYLYCNNSIQPPAGAASTSQEVTKLCNLLSPYHRKAAHALAENVASLLAAVGLDRLGFLTLTFPDNCSDHKEAYSRFRSFNTNYLANHAQFGDWLCVKERQRRGAWHYHLLIDCGGDIRTGIDWDQVASQKYSSANEHLRFLWADLRANLPKYGFGRSELLPVRSNIEAMGRYIGKYISKHIGSRKEEDAGVRLCSYSRNWPRSNSHFQWYTANSQKWRANVQKLAEWFDCSTLEELTAKLGRRWAFRYAEDIAAGVVPIAVREEILADMEIDLRFSEKLSSMQNLSLDADAQPREETVHQHQENVPLQLWSPAHRRPD